MQHNFFFSGSFRWASERVKRHKLCIHTWNATTPRIKPLVYSGTWHLGLNSIWQDTCALCTHEYEPALTQASCIVHYIIMQNQYIICRYFHIMAVKMHSLTFFDTNMDHHTIMCLKTPHVITWSLINNMNYTSFHMCTVH